IHEFLSREVNDLAVTGMAANMPGHRMHQVGFAQTDAAVEKQRVERHHVNRVGARLGDPAGGSVGQLVGFADDEIPEGEALIKSRELRPVLADIRSEGGLKEARIGWVKA